MRNPYFWIFVFVILGVVGRILKPTIKGWLGEKEVSIRLSRLPEDEYTIINNVMLPSIRKKGSQ
mgnify:CR=1 FL=1